MASQLEYLTAVGAERNPAQETEYRNLLAQGGQQFKLINGKAMPLSSTELMAQQQDALLKKQSLQTQDFLGRYTTGIQGARDAISTELNLPGLREGAFTAGQTARDVSRQVQDVLPTQQTIAKQVGISAPNIQRRAAAETAKLQPSLESASRALQDTTAAQQFGEQQYTQRLQEFTQPYQLEASFLSDALGREFSGFTQQMENELNITLQKMANNQALSMAELQRAQQLADSEAEFERQKQLLTFQQQLGIGTEQQLKAGGLGSYYQAPKAMGASGW